MIKHTLVQAEDIRHTLLAFYDLLLDLNVQEVGGNNKGPVVSEIIRLSWGKSVAIPWCAILQDVLYPRACKAAGVAPLFDVGASSSALVTRGQNLGLFFTNPKLAKPGDLFIVPGGPTDYRHTGAVYSPVDSKGNFKSFEGNSDRPDGHDGITTHQRAGTSVVYVATTNEPGRTFK